MRMGRALAMIPLSSALLTVAWNANAQRRGGRSSSGQSARQPPRPTNYSAAIQGDLNGVQWGWTREELMRYFRARIQDEYRDRIARAPGAIEEDRVRAEMNEKIRTVRESYFEFNGNISGYDSSFLREEFTHNNQEAMMKVQSENSDDYYFFIQGRLWKLYRAFHTRVFAGVDFDGFTAALEARYGASEHKSGALYEGGRPMQWLEWQDETTRARAVDNNAGYGFYCLVFEEKATVARIAQLRPNARPTQSRRNPLIDSVTHDDPDREVQDTNQDIVDRIYSQRRAGDGGVASPDSGTAAPSPAAPAQGSSGGSSSSMR